MDIVTYPNPEVIKFIQDHVVPVRLPSYAKPEAADFNVNLKEAYEKLQADQLRIDFCRRKLEEIVGSVYTFYPAGYL